MKKIPALLVVVVVSALVVIGWLLFRQEGQVMVECVTEVPELSVKEGELGVEGTRFTSLQLEDDEYGSITRYSCESGSLMLSGLGGSPLNFNICGRQGVLPGGYFVDMDSAGKVVRGPSKISP